MSRSTPASVPAGADRGRCPRGAPQNVVLGKVLLLSKQIRALKGEGSEAKLLDLWLRLQGEVNNYVDSSKSTE